MGERGRWKGGREEWRKEAEFVQISAQGYCISGGP